MESGVAGRCKAPAPPCPHRPPPLLPGSGPCASLDSQHPHTHEVLAPGLCGTSLPTAYLLEPPGHLPVSCPVYMPDPSLGPFLPAAPAPPKPKAPSIIPHLAWASCLRTSSHGPTSTLQSSPQLELKKFKSDHKASDWASTGPSPGFQDRSQTHGSSSCKTEVKNRREQSSEAQATEQGGEGSGRPRDLRRATAPYDSCRAAPGNLRADTVAKTL